MAKPCGSTMSMAAPITAGPGETAGERIAEDEGGIGGGGILAREARAEMGEADGIERADLAAPEAERQHERPEFRGDKGQHGRAGRPNSAMPNKHLAAVDSVGDEAHRHLQQDVADGDGDAEQDDGVAVVADPLAIEPGNSEKAPPSTVPKRSAAPVATGGPSRRKRAKEPFGR